MTGAQRSLPVGGRGYGRGWAAVACLCGVCAGAWAQAGSADGWRAAAAARAAFEESSGQHSRAAYAGVMNEFRAIYHGDPSSMYAPRAVEAVAELLAEEGRELNDRKALRDAAGQYEFLAKAYPASSLTVPGLGKALALLGPGGADDAVEAGRVRAALARQSPRGPAGNGAGAGGTREGSRLPAGITTARAMAPNPGAVAEPSEPLASPVDNQGRVPGAAPAMVTGIRHWSTATYTRVVVDLGGEVEFQAARVEHPDRVFFDLHGAKLAPGLAGKSFAITDAGFLKTIRAGQAGADVTRIVLDVQPVAEYSAFLLPNPTRLIIDVHGKAAGNSALAGQRDSESEVQRSAVAGAGNTGASAGPRGGGGTSGRPLAALNPLAEQPSQGPEQPSQRPEQLNLPEATGKAGPPNGVGSLAAPMVRVEPKAAESGGSGGSSLPPMRVTDGSANFGLPPKRTQAALQRREQVAQPRVVLSAQPTAARPVPNSVSSVVAGANREIAEVSEGPGVITATGKPTSRPIVDKGRGSGSRAERGDGATESGGVPSAPAPPTADGESTLIRALGLKIGRIVIDAGHGGHDSGTLGVDGIEEKDVVLDVALRLGKLLHDRLGAEIVYTRADDTFVPLETRTAIANKAQADLFLSVHANSSPDASARGVEVYYLNFTSDPDAMAVAGRENAVSSGRVNQLSDLVKKIALKDKIDESRELAADVDQSLYSGLRKGNERLRDRGVKKAPFVVLIGANMPSILAEISFVTNPDDAEELSRPAYRERVAESLYGGVARYAASINGVPGSPAGGRRTRATERAAR